VGVSGSIADVDAGAVRGYTTGGSKMWRGDVDGH